MVTAFLKNYRQSPRKVRLIADVIRGKKVADALDILTLNVKRASDPIKKLLESAVANAKHNAGLDIKDLYIKEIRVDEGVTLHRWRARARGRASAINKRTSRIKVAVGLKDEKEEIKKVKAVPKKKEVKKVPSKKVSTKKPATKKATTKRKTAKAKK